MKKYYTALFGTVILTILLLLTAAFSAGAGQGSEEVARPRLQLSTPGLFPSRVPPELGRRTGPDVAAQDPPAGAPSFLSSPHSAVAVQTWVDGNWEVAFIPDTDDHRRLTFNGATDTWPRLNRGSSQIVFASDRDGDYELFTMQVDGSNVRQLTFNNSDDVAPTWSPDGRRIAFQAYRDGQAEIYVMNVDGSGQQRLTVEAAYDGVPDWSPDGARISFTSLRSGGYRIMVMNTDGTNQQQLSDQPYSFHPAWSPDGSRIAFDADADLNGWQELWVMNADGSSEHELHNAGVAAYDEWVGSWSPEGDYLSFTGLWWAEYQEQWYLTQTQLYMIEVEHGPIFSLTQGDVNLYPHWETTDAHPPSSSVHRLPRYSPVDGFRIAWSGADIGPAGLDFYDVQFAHGSSGDWVDLLSGTDDTSTAFAGMGGNTASFRSRAHDRHYNIEPWPRTPDATTTFYKWSFAGHVADNRGTPLGGIDATTDGGMLEEPVTGPDGAFVARATTDSPTMVTISEPGYGASVEAWYEPGSRYNRLLYLPPADNVLANSTLENPIAAGNWSANGTLPLTLTSETAASGFSSLRLGEGCTATRCLGSGEAVPGSLDNREVVATTVDKDGTLHLLWRYANDPAQQQQVQYSRRSLDGTWTTPVTIDTAPFAHYARAIRMVADGQGGLHAAWLDPEGFKYAQRPPGGPWASPAIIGQLEYGYASNGVVALEIGPGDELYLIYLENFASYFMSRRADEDWSAPQQLWPEHLSSGPLMVVGPDSRVHVVARITDQTGTDLLLYRWRSAEGIWSSDQIIPPGADPFLDPLRLMVDQGGTLHLLASGRSLFYTQLRQGAGWSAWEETPVTGYSVAGVVDSQSRLHVVYIVDGGSGPEVYYRRRLPGSGWQAPVALNDLNDLRSFRLEIGPNDILHLLSEDEPGTYSHLTAISAGSSGMAAISQSVMIPATTNAPTLAFMARGENDRAGDSSSLRVTVEDGVAASMVFSGTLDATWRPYWADLSAWSGQVVTVSFGLEQAASDPDLQLWLDDVTLGSAHSDGWVGIIGPTSAAPATELTSKLFYGNAGGVAADDVTVRLTLPPELSFVAASVPPATTTPLAWEVGALAPGAYGEIELTLAVDGQAATMTTVTLVAELLTALEEAHQANNLVDADLFIGQRTFLTILLRQ